MHKGTHGSREEYQDDTPTRAYRNEHQVDSKCDDASYHKSAARKSQWVFGNLFECLSGEEECTHGRIPFGGIDYCIWPLKDTSANFHHKPPCTWDAEPE